jgi:hypothetical protein
VWVAWMHVYDLYKWMYYQACHDSSTASCMRALHVYDLYNWVYYQACS